MVLLFLFKIYVRKDIACVCAERKELERERERVY